MKTETQKGILLKRNMKKLMTNLLPMLKNMINNKINNKINQIKSSFWREIMPNKLKKRRNTLKRISIRIIKSLEKNSRVIATKNINSAPKINHK